MDLATFGIATQIAPPTACFTVSGELDAFHAPRLSRQVREAAHDGCRDSAIDLGAVTFVDCGGVGSLLRLRADVSAAGGSLLIQSASDCVRRLCTLLGLDATLGVAPLAWRERGAATEVVA